jgi:hypothetical protein
MESKKREKAFGRGEARMCVSGPEAKQAPNIQIEKEGIFFDTRPISYEEDADERSERSSANVDLDFGCWGSEAQGRHVNQVQVKIEGERECWEQVGAVNEQV